LIAADTSSLVNFLAGEDTPDRDLIRRAMRAQDLWLPPPVKTELLSGRSRGTDLVALFDAAPMLAIAAGFWDRAGDARRLLLSKGLKARLADTLIAQCCIDADAPLITSDADYRHFERWCGLKLAA
jgi:predicted nucleic acid-binding protein